MIASREDFPALTGREYTLYSTMMCYVNAGRVREAHWHLRLLQQHFVKSHLVLATAGGKVPR